MMGRKHALVLPLFVQAHCLGIYRFALEIARRDVTVTLVGSGKLIALVRSFDDTKGLDFNFISYRDFGFEDDVPSGNLIADAVTEIAHSRKKFQPVLDKLVADRNKRIPGPTCIIADRLLTWAIDSAKDLNVPFYQFFSCGATYVRVLQAEYSMVGDGSLVIKRDSEGVQYLEQQCEGHLNIPGLPSLLSREMPLSPPPTGQRGKTSMTDLDIGCITNEADGVIVNTIYELEAPQIDAIREVWKHLPPAKIPKLFLVGPLSNAVSFKDRCLYNELDKKSGFASLNWLDGRKPFSVVYICVGSIAELSPDQVEEVTQALEASEQGFLMVASRGMERAVPPDFVARTKEKGLVVSGWVPQLHILQHPAVGGFVTHCGWNSTIESISSGVPMACWPQLPNDQVINCRYLVDVLKIAVELRTRTPESSRTYVGLEEAVRLLLSDEGKVLRARVQELKTKVDAALADGGSTKIALRDLVESIPP